MATALGSRSTRFELTALLRVSSLYASTVTEGNSGRYDEIAKRPGFKAMLEAIGRREADVVVVHTLDRWARNVLVTLTAFKTLGDAQCAFVSLTRTSTTAHQRDASS
jgi:DNA invertase Pin-like site-specific DNA recombinase